MGQDNSRRYQASPHQYVTLVTSHRMISKSTATTSLTSTLLTVSSHQLLHRPMMSPKIPFPVRR